MCVEIMGWMLVVGGLEQLARLAPLVIATLLVRPALLVHISELQAAS